MKPTGWNDEARLTDAIMRFSPAAEPLDVSRRRLEAAIRADALALGVEAALTPARVAYAYRHHPALGVGRGERAAPRRRGAKTPEAVIRRAELAAETRRALDETIRRAEARKLAEKERI